MKIKLFISFAAFVAASALMCSCSNEESADSNNNSNSNSNGQLTAFTGGIVTEVPMERMQLSTPEISTEVPDFLTRTSMNRQDIGKEGAFFWEPKDVIYVEDDKGKLCKSQNEIIESARRTTFLVGGSYTKKEYNVYYYGTKSDASEKKKVVIANNQTLAAFNNTKHFGAAGDCGVATAKKTTDQGKSGYSFELEHKASYLCFLPYMAPQWDRANLKLKSVEITSDNNIAGTYDLTQTGLSATGTNESKTITLNVGTDGLLLANQTAETPNIDNSLYVVIAPGTHDLKVKYTVVYAMNTVMTITKSYKSHTFGANKICDIPVNLSYAYLYSGHNYYTWDAKENYWSGHEWDSDDPWQPPVAGERNDNYPKSNADASRWYHEGTGPFEASVNPLFKQLPNANEIGWYVKKGDAYWDGDKSWTAFGKKCKGGIWLKKLSVIAKENGKELADLKKADPDGTNLLTSYKYYETIPKSGKPADSEISNYFFLPALHYYHYYKLNGSGHYWSSSADPSHSYAAYSLRFHSRCVELIEDSRYRGLVAQPFE